MPNIDELTVQFKGKGVGTVANNIRKIADAVEVLASKSQGIDSAKFSSLASSIGLLKKSVPTSNQVTNLKELAVAIAALNNAAGSGDITTFANGINTVSNALNGLKGTPKKQIDNITSSLQQAGQQAQKTASQMNGVSPKSKGQGKQATPTPKTPSVSNVDLANQFAESNKAIEKSTINISKMKQALLGLRTVVPTNKMKQLQESTEKARQRYNDLRESIRKAIEAGNLKPSSKSFESKQKELDRLRKQYDDLILKQRQLAQEGGDIRINPNFGKAYSGLKQSVSGVKQVFSGIGSVIKSANGYINTFISKVKSIGSASKKAKKDTASLKDTVKKLASEITRLSKMLKLMITRMALRAAIKEVGNGFKSLALHSQEFDNNMSNLINSSKTLGYSISGMAGQLINALAPVLLKIIELVTRAVNALNQLFSALRGKSTWNKAKDFTGSWSDSIKEANGQAKKLKKTVLGFDELNQLQDNKSKGGGGSDAITDMFEDVPIDPWFQDLSEKIKKWAKKLFEPIKNAWDKVGDWVKAKWKYALDELKKLGSSIARDFWRVWEEPETEQIFKNIFIIVGEIGRAVGNLAKQFRKAWDENDTGYKILKAIRDIILIITNHLRNMATATADWAATLDFSPLLTSVQKWLESLKPAMDAIMGILEDFYKEVVLKFTKWVIESGLPKLIDVFTRFNQEVKWEELRQKLHTLWEHLEPFMETVGEGLIIFIARVAQAIANFINGEKFEEFLQFIEDWMDSVTPEDVANGIEKLVKAIAGLKIAGIVVGALSTFSGVFGGLITVCKGLGAIASGVSTFAGAIGGLGTGLLPVIGVVAAIVILMYSFVESYGGFEGALNKLKETAQKVGDYLKKVAEKINLIPSEYSEGTSSVEILKDAFSDLADALGDAKGLWDMLFGLIGTTIDLVGTVALPILKGIIDEVTGFVEKLAGAIKQISGLFDMFFGWISADSERVNKGKNSFLEGFVGTTTGDKDLVGLVKDITNGYDELNRKQEEANSLANLLSESQNGVSTSLGLLAQYQRDNASSLDTYKGSLDGVKTKQEEVASTTDTLSSKSSSFSDTFKTLAGLHKDTQSTFKTHNDVLNEMSKKNSEVTDTLKPQIDAYNQSKDGLDKLRSAIGDTDGVLGNYSSSLDGVRTALDLAKDAEKGVVDYTPEFTKSMDDARESLNKASEEAEKAGENIVKGVEEPIKNADPKSSIDIFKETFMTLFKAAFGIESPAKEMYPIGNNILLGVTEGFKEKFDEFKGVMQDFYDNHVKTWFDKDKWSFDGVGEGLKKTFEGAKTAIKGVWNDIADKLNGEHEIGSSKMKINLPKFARGGFPEDGLFIANHNELVGSFSNGKTAVANNEQIVAGIERGVYSAVSAAMATNSGGSSYISNEILVDGEVIARTITKAQEKMNRRYSPQTS